MRARAPNLDAERAVNGKYGKLSPFGQFLCEADSFSAVGWDWAASPEPLGEPSASWHLPGPELQPDPLAAPDLLLQDGRLPQVRQVQLMVFHLLPVPANWHKMLALRRHFSSGGEPSPVLGQNDPAHFGEVLCYRLPHVWQEALRRPGGGGGSPDRPSALGGASAGLSH